MVKLNYKSVLEQKLYLEVVKQIPSDIKEYINSLASVKRFDFKEYPQNVIVDNTRTHTLKCIFLANMIKAPVNKKLLLRTLWVHDIPELLTDDLTVIEKYRRVQADKEFVAKETKAANILLSASDQKLLENFNSANECLKGKGSCDLGKLPMEFIIAKIIDNSEGNLTFHYFVSKWVASNNFKPELLPPTDSLQHTFKTNTKFMQKIKTDMSATDAKPLIDLIEAVLKNIRSLWNEVPSNRIPEAIKINL